MIRLSGTLASRPGPNSCRGARYYATDNQTVYFSTGDSWQANWPLASSDLNGTFGGPLAQRPPSGSCVGWGYIDSGTGNQYEAFPDAWAAATIGGGGGGGGGTGNVVGPAAGAIDGHLAVFDGPTGKLVKDGGAVPSGGGGAAVIASGTAVLGTAAIASGALATAVTVAAAGVLATDTIIWTPNADISGVTGYAPLTGGGLMIYPYPTAGAVNFKVGNPTAASITPGAVTLNWKVLR